MVKAAHIAEQIAIGSAVRINEDNRSCRWSNICHRDVLLFPQAEQIVLDNVSTHTASARYSAFAPAEAKRMCDRLEVHDTPRHGSWLNIAEIELSVLSRQCLARRIPDQDTLRQETSAWVDERNVRKATIEW